MIVRATSEATPEYVGIVGHHPVIHGGRAQMKDVLIIALTVASVISLFTGGVNEAVAILVIVVINISPGLIQEYKSEKSLQALIKCITYRTKVLRSGEVKEVDAKYIVPGDVVFLETGDRVLADLRLIEADELEIDESIVTGESYPAHKISSPIMVRIWHRKKWKTLLSWEPSP